MSNSNIRDMLLVAPEGQMDEPLKDIIRKFDVEPTAVQLLEALDNATYFASASGFVVSVLATLFEKKPQGEKDEAIKYANLNWRKEYSK